MKPSVLSRVNAIFMTVLLAAWPAVAQEQNPPQGTNRNGQSITGKPDAEKVSFDSLLSADSYKFYGELRMIGQQTGPGGLLDMVAPLNLLGSESKTIVKAIKFLSEHSVVLANSRLLFAGGPAKPKLPQFLIALEMSSDDEARKFEPEFRRFISNIVAPDAPKTEKSGPGSAKSSTRKQPEGPPKDSYFIKRVNRLLLLTDSSLEFKDLRPPRSLLLTEDPSFSTIRARLTSEPLFIYLNTRLSERQPAKTKTKVASGAGGDAKLANKSDEPVLTSNIPDINESTPSVNTRAPLKDLPTNVSKGAKGAEPESPPTVIEVDGAVAQVHPSQRTDVVTPVPQLMNLMFGGLSGKNEASPDAAGFAIATEGPDLVVRALLLNDSLQSMHPVPFFPMLISGASLSPEFSSVLPADSEVVVDLSVDLPRIYESALAGRGDVGLIGDDGDALSNADADRRIRSDEFEKTYGFNIKDALNHFVGNEIAVSIPLEIMSGSVTTRATAGTLVHASNFMVLISIKDQDAVRLIMPQVCEAAGLKAPGEAGAKENLNDVEITSYKAGAFAFVKNVLIFSPDLATIRHAVEAYGDHQTLSTSPAFKSATGWQPRQTLGSVYISSKLMERLRSSAQSPVVQTDPDSREILSQLNFEPQALSYALTGDGASMFHELHIPRNFIAMSIAQMSLTTKPKIANSEMAIRVLKSIAEGENLYKSSKGSGKFGTLEEMIKGHFIQKYLMEDRGYKFDIRPNDDGFVATAVPTIYGKTGILSFYMDEKGVIRAGDHGGTSASSEDKTVEAVGP